MSKRMIVNLIACAVIAAGGAGLSVPLSATVDTRPNCMVQLMEAAEAGQAYCEGIGFNSSRTTGKCVNGELTEVTVTCFNA